MALVGAAVLTAIARWIVRYCPQLASEVQRERSRLESAARAATIHVLAVRAERLKYGKQVNPGTYGRGDEAS